jgi:TPR repeat protein
MKDNDEIDDLDDKKLNQAHQQLLMDEDFQQIRSYILSSLDKEKRHLLHENEKNYIQDHEPPPSLEYAISQQYQQWIKNIPEHKSKPIFSSIRNFFSRKNNFGFTFENMGLMSIGLLVGILLAPQKESSLSGITLADNQLSYYSQIEQLNDEHSMHNLDKVVQLIEQGELIAAKKQLKSENILSFSINSIQNNAELGDSDAQALLGWMYEKGYQVEQNDNLAFKWYQHAAKQGEVLAQNSVAIMYKNGWGIDKNEPKAIHWFAMSATQGYAEAQYNLAMMFQNSAQLNNQEKAEYWLNKSAKQGYLRASIALKNLPKLQHPISDSN